MVRDETERLLTNAIMLLNSEDLIVKLGQDKELTHVLALNEMFEC